MRLTKYLIFLAFLLPPFVASAQEMSIREFYLAETDLTANTLGTIVNDQNGEVCALIKMETTLDGFSFDTGSLGVMEVRRKGGEMWIYVPFGIRKLTISHPRLGIIRDYPLPCHIEKGRTYILKLNATLGNRTYDSNKKQKMILQVYPTSARVEINGMSVTLDRNGICEQELSFGVYDVTVSASKYHTMRTQIEINDPKKIQRFDIRLRQAFGWLKITGSGDESLSIGGRSTQFTPGRNLELMSGNYHVLLQKPLYKPYERTIEVKDSVVVEINPRFVPNFRELQFKVYNDAEIWVDDVKVGKGDWTGKLEYGTHRIECKKESHKPTELVLNVDSQTLGPIMLESPTPIYGTIIVSSEPAGAEVFIDGQYEGVSPGTFRKLIGKHTISIRRTGFNTHEETIDLEDRYSTRIEAKLENIIPITIASTPSATLYVDGIKVGKTLWSKTVIAGQHTVKLTAPRYYDLEKKIEVNEPYKKYEFKLKRRYYYDRGFLIGANAMSGFRDVTIDGYIGSYIKNFNLEVHVQYGVMPSETIYWNYLQTDSEPFQYQYNPLMVGGKFGYGFILGSRVRLTPQIGSYFVMLKGKQIDTNPASFKPDSCYGVNIFAGGKVSVAIAPSIELNISPEYAFGVYKTALYKEIYNVSPMAKGWLDGFRLSFGVGLYF